MERFALGTSGRADLCGAGLDNVARDTVKTELHAWLADSPSKGMDKVKITSRCASGFYVSRLVKNSGRYGKRRYLVDASRILRSLPAEVNPIMD